MRLPIVIIALMLGTTGCAALGDDDTSSSSIKVAAAFYPLQYVAQRVAGNLADVENLTTPGKEPHDLEPTIKETAIVAEADLVIHERGLQPAIDDAIAQNAVGEIIDAAAVVDLEPVVSGTDGDVDPHFWLDPVRMADLGDAVADALADIDPGNAADYAANAASLRADLEALDAQFVDGLDDCARHTIVVSHDAFGYFAKYGVEVAPVAGLSPDAEPTPADLAELQQLIADDGITTVFGERLAPPRLTATLADDMGVKTAILDPLEGLTDQTADDDYLSLMEQNLTALEEANGCR